MEVIRTVMLNVIAIVFITTILDLLLPESSFRSYIKMAMGFFVVLVLLQPVANLLQQDAIGSTVRQEIQQAEQMVLAQAVQSADVAVDTEAYQASYMAQLEQQYAAQTAQQVEALLLLTDTDVLQVSCMFELAAEQNKGEEKQLMIYITLADCAKDEQQRIQTAISDYFGVSAAQVQVQAVQNE